MDRTFAFRKGQKAAVPAERIHIQANMFAAALLMPQDWLAVDATPEALDGAGRSATGIDGVAALAARYGVSQPVMTLRLAALHALAL